MKPQLTPAQLEVCLAKLAAYYPGDWGTERAAVWAQELVVIPFDVAMRAIADMARAENFPTVARLLEHAGRAPGHTGEVIAVGEARFLPGTGWVGGRRPTNGHGQAALEAPADDGAAVRSIRTARSALRHDEDSDR